MQNEITHAGPLLSPSGSLVQVGWSRQPLFDNNLEQAAFYPLILRPFQRFRIKRWDYYAVFTPQRFFSATIADLGYAGNIFVYTVDFERGDLHEEGLVIPFARGVNLPKNRDDGISSYSSKDVRLNFGVTDGWRQLKVDWPTFHRGRGIQADIRMSCHDDHESMNIIIPIQGRRFYYNSKINCLPAEGSLTYGEIHESLDPKECLGSLDWGRGVWEYNSFWNWASASGYLADGRSLGLNLGAGFGDTTAATENCIILDGTIHKLDQVSFNYDPQDYNAPWKFNDNAGRLDLEFVPFVERVAQTDLKLIYSEVHQMFGRYAGVITCDNGELIAVKDLIGFAEEHHARW